MQKFLIHVVHASCKLYRVETTCMSTKNDGKENFISKHNFSLLHRQPKLTVRVGYVLY